MLKARSDELGEVGSMRGGGKSWRGLVGSLAGQRRVAGGKETVGERTTVLLARVGAGWWPAGDRALAR